MELKEMQERRETLHKQAENLKAQYNAALGAIANMDYLITEISAKNKAKATATESKKKK